MVYDAYNLSLINGTGLVPFLQTINTNLMFGWFGNFALIALFTFFLIGFVTYTNDFKKSVGYASLIIAIMSIFFRGLELVGDSTVFISWVIVAIVTAVLFLTDK